MSRRMPVSLPVRSQLVLVLVLVLVPVLVSLSLARQVPGGTAGSADAGRDG